MTMIYIKMMSGEDKPDGNSSKGYTLVPVDTEKNYIKTGYWAVNQDEFPNISDLGSRLFFKRYSLDWADFIANGIEEEKLLATGNALAINLVEFARKQQASQSTEQLIQAVKEFK